MKKVTKRINKLMDRLIATPGKKISAQGLRPGMDGHIKDKTQAAELLEEASSSSPNNRTSSTRRTPTRC